jgi:hypothetical protein
MSTVTYILATRDPELLRAWWVLVPTGARVVTMSELVQGTAMMPPGLPMIVVLEEAVAGEMPQDYLSVPMVFVGDRGGPTFERLSQKTGSARVCLSREESRTRLGEFLPLLEEIAARAATTDVVSERRASSTAVASLTSSLAKQKMPPLDGEWWDWMIDAVEAIGTRDDLLAEFRQQARRMLRTSHVVFFLREETGFRADRGEFFCSTDDPVSQYLGHDPVLVDGKEWAAEVSPVVEISIRQRLAAWSLRLIVPMHDNGRLAGWIGLGVRDDGLPYDAADRVRALSIARLLRQMLVSASPKPGGARERSPLVAKYLPGIILLDANEKPAEGTPAAVRGLIAEVRQLRVNRRLTPTVGQPIRASAGIIAETQGVWVSWEDAGAEILEQHRRERAERLALLHDLALTLNHELGNSLVSLAALRHNPGAETNSPVLLAAIKRDIASLEAINRHLSSIPTFSEVSAENVDLRALVYAVGRKCGISVETGAEEILLDVAPRLIEFGLESILESIAENRPGLGKRELVMSLRTVGAGDNLAAVLGIRGAGLALEGILPAPKPGATPTHGRIGVFIAKEIIHLHGGAIEAGTGTNGPEITITLRRW